MSEPLEAQKREVAEREANAFWEQLRPVVVEMLVNQGGSDVAGGYIEFPGSRVEIIAKKNQS